MYKVCGSIDLSIDDIKTCIKGSQLLSSKFSYDRAKSGKSAVYVDESYFIRYAILECITNLEKDATFNEN